MHGQERIVLWRRASATFLSRFFVVGERLFELEVEDCNALRNKRLCDQKRAKKALQNFDHSIDFPEAKTGLIVARKQSQGFVFGMFCVRPLLGRNSLSDRS